MSWRKLESGEVMEELTPQEVTALRSMQNTEERLPFVLERVTSSVRGKIQAGGYTLGPEGTIPDQFRLEAVDIARWRWLISFPTLKAMQTKERKDAYDGAIETLNKVQNGDIAVENPDAASGAAASKVATPSFEQKTRTFTRDDEDGI